MCVRLRPGEAFSSRESQIFPRGAGGDPNRFKKPDFWIYAHQLAKAQFQRNTNITTQVKLG